MPPKSRKGGAKKEERVLPPDDEVDEELAVAYACLESKYGHLPFFLSWPQLHTSQYILDFELLSLNAESYTKAIR